MELFFFYLVLILHEYRVRVMISYWAHDKPLSPSRYPPQMLLNGVTSADTGHSYSNCPIITRSTMQITEVKTFKIYFSIKSLKKILLEIVGPSSENTKSVKHSRAYRNGNLNHTPTSESHTRATKAPSHRELSYSPSKHLVICYV